MAGKACLHQGQKSICHHGRGFGYRNARIFESLKLGCSSSFSATDDRSSMAHATTWRRGCSGNKTCNRLLAILLDPLCGFFFGRTADLADEDDAVGIRIGSEFLDHIQM